jgi:TATA-binding protein-associated factor
MKRGAEITLRELCDQFGDKVFQIVPKLKQSISQKVMEVFPLSNGANGVEESDQLISSNFSLGQEVIDSLTVLTTIVPYLSEGLWDEVRIKIGYVFRGKGTH